MEPKIILFDEPLSNLDAASACGCGRRSDPLQQRLSLTAIFVTHDQSEALTMSDTIVVMSAGEDRTGRNALRDIPPPREPLRGRIPGHEQLHRGHGLRSPPRGRALRPLPDLHDTRRHRVRRRPRPGEDAEHSHRDPRGGPRGGRGARRLTADPRHHRLLSLRWRCHQLRRGYSLRTTSGRAPGTADVQAVGHETDCAVDSALMWAVPQEQEGA